MYDSNGWKKKLIRKRAITIDQLPLKLPQNAACREKEVVGIDKLKSIIPLRSTLLEAMLDLYVRTRRLHN